MGNIHEKYIEACGNGDIETLEKIMKHHKELGLYLPFSFFPRTWLNKSDRES